MRTKLFLMAALAAPLFSFAQKHAFTITGKISNYHSPAKIYLDYAIDNEEFIDSAVLKNGRFKFTGVINGTAQAYLALNRKGDGLNFNDNKEFYLEAGVIEANSKNRAANFVITGTVTNRDNDRFSALFKAVSAKAEALSAERNKLSAAQQKDTALMAKYDASENLLIAQRDTLLTAFIRQNPNSFVSLAHLKSYAYAHEFDEVNALYQNLSAGLKSTGDGKYLADQLSRMKLVRLGATAPEFELPDTLGKQVSLSSFRGKYVLVDFWASWCHPCRVENPNLIKAYLRYKNHSFTILSVSLDQETAKKAWLQAISSDGLLWPQVSDLKGFNNAAAKMYGISAIPQSFLLDPDGKIIGKNFRGDELGKKLKEIFRD